jgi:hypothetical protein
LFVEYYLGARPQIGKGTLIYLPISNNKDFTKDSSKWDARTQHIDGQTLTVHVHIPSNVAVGVWRLRVSTKQQGSRNIKSFEVKENIYVLFNAWNKGNRNRCVTCNTVIQIKFNSHKFKQ